MLPAKDANKMLERLQVKEDTVWLFFYLFDHYKVLGLPSGKELTDQHVSEAFEAQLLSCCCKLLGLPSNLPLEEIREKVGAMGDLESIVQQSRIKMQKEDEESKCDRIGLLVISCCILMDPEKRKSYKSWWWLAKRLERLKIINRSREKEDEYLLMSFDDMRLVCILYPLILGGMVITFPVYLPARICWLIGKASCKAIQTAVLKRSDNFTDDKKAGECSSGGEDLQEWELVKEDDCC